MSSAAQKHVIRHEPVRIRRKIVSAAVAVCAKELAPFHISPTRKHDAAELWRIVFRAAEWDDIYRLTWILDYYAFECTTSYMDLALKLRRALSLHWVNETRIKIHKESRTWPASEKSTASTPKQPKGASRPRRSSSPAKTSSQR